ncbi:E3 ubiquitin-protein ligase TRIM56-like [Ptychodera flava]|uniref:E3 ubiquitin-protein ligase TRIM56-like n=1 Tax=Ptychodera flava TaxID=63121 RepID=UPI00396AA71F
MAMATDITVDDILDQIGEDFLTCTICFDQFTKPKILPCHHTYCEHCLYALVEKSNGVLVCPSCRKLCDIPTGGVKNLENNFFLNSLLETVQKRPERSAVKINKACEICGNTDASHVCLDCQLQQYCSNCEIVHKKSKGTMNHVILPIKEYGDKKAADPISVLPVAYCNKHKTCVFRFYCETCQVPICSECVVIDHPNTSHAYKYLDKVAAEYRDKLLDYARKLEAKAKEADESKSEAVVICNEYIKKCDEEKMKVVKKADDMRKRVITEENSLKDEVKEEYEIRIKNQYIHIDKLHFLYSRLVSMINYLEFIRRQKNVAQLVQREDSVSQYNQELKELHNIPNIAHGEVEFFAAAEGGNVLGNLIIKRNKYHDTNSKNEEKDTSKNEIKNEESYKIHNEGSESGASNVGVAAFPDSVPQTVDDCFLICSVCFEQFSNPKILPCHHTFCEDCLHVVIKESVKKLNCPSCQKTCHLTVDGVSALQDNTYMQSLIDASQERRETT